MAKCQVVDEFSTKVTKNDVAVESDLAEYIQLRDTLVAAYDGNCEDVTGDAKIFKEQVDQIRAGELGSLLANIDVHEAVFAERAALYAEYFDDNTPLEMGAFKNDLLRHLAGNIVVKDHRVRYQKEQFDRFVASQGFQPLASERISLSEFATAYAHLIEVMTTSSHHHKCPKIAANYESF